MSYKNATLTPAYGRDYKSIKSLIEDWKAGKDFQMMPAGQMCSIDEVPYLKKNGFTHIHFRYNQLERVHVIKL